MSSKIGIYEFNLMPLDLQAESLWEYGVFVTNIKESGGIRSNLYRLNDFYVEALFEKPNENTFRFQTFKKGKHLDKYLDEIEIANLY